MLVLLGGVRFRGAGGEHLVGEAGGVGGVPALPAGRFRAEAGAAFWGTGYLAWFEAGARRKSRPGGNRLGLCRGWDGGRLPRVGRVGGPSCCGSLTVGEVSFGWAWPSSRVRCDEGGHSGRFRLGGLGLVQSRCDDDWGDGPSVDGRQDAGPGFRPVDVVMARCRVRPQSPGPVPAAPGSPGRADGRGPSGRCAGRCPGRCPEWAAP